LAAAGVILAFALIFAALTFAKAPFCAEPLDWALSTKVIPMAVTPATKDDSVHVVSLSVLKCGLKCAPERNHARICRLRMVR
jgi:hypothetical protein